VLWAFVLSVEADGVGNILVSVTAVDLGFTDALEANFVDPGIPDEAVIKGLATGLATGDGGIETVNAVNVPESGLCCGGNCVDGLQETSGED